MSDLISFDFIGWCHETGHDKVWSSFTVDNKLYCAWGRRGGTLQFKSHNSQYKLKNLKQQKINKGYKEVDKFQLFVLFPDFDQKVEEELVFATLSDKIR